MKLNRTSLEQIVSENRRPIFRIMLYRLTCQNLITRAAVEAVRRSKFE
jgi:hypothetical protein